MATPKAPADPRSRPRRAAAPRTAPETNPLPVGFDVERLIAQLREGDPRAVREAYRRTFAGPLGRLVLAHFVGGCGVGAPQGAGVAGDDRHYAAGRHDAGLELLSAAGFDQASAVLAVMTDTPPEGYTDDQGSSGHDGRDDSDHIPDH